MRHIYRIYPDNLYTTIDDSIAETKLKYANLCSDEGIVIDSTNYKMSIDDIALLYRQSSANATSVSHDDCTCFAVCFGDIGMMSIDDCASRTRIVNITDDDIIDGQLVLQDSTRYVINNPSNSITFVMSDTDSEYVKNYEIDLTLGDSEEIQIDFSPTIQWVGLPANHFVYHINQRYLIYIDGTLGLYTEI